MGDLLFLVVICSFLSIHGHSWDPSTPFPSCLTAGTTWDSSFVYEVFFDIESPEDCQLACFKDLNCAGFSWLSADTELLGAQSCVLFDKTGDGVPYENVASGPPLCPCTISGECTTGDHNVLEVVPDTLDSVACNQLCKSREDCVVFTFLEEDHPLSNLCILYRECEQFDQMCSHCTTGVQMCQTCSFNQMVNNECDNTTWTTIQRRGQFGNPQDFFSSKLWTDYVNGFGHPNGEFWFGLKQLAAITSLGQWQLRVELEDFDGKPYLALYSNFTINSEGPFSISVSGYDAEQSTLQDSLSYVNGAPFSTSDNDNDYSSANCAQQFMGAWWYTKCHSSNLNGFNYNSGTLTETPEFYAKGIVWRNEKNVPEQDYYFSWPKVEMKIRRQM